MAAAAAPALLAFLSALAAGPFFGPAVSFWPAVPGASVVRVPLLGARRWASALVVARCASVLGLSALSVGGPGCVSVFVGVSWAALAACPAVAVSAAAARRWSAALVFGPPAVAAPACLPGLGSV